MRAIAVALLTIVGFGFGIAAPMVANASEIDAVTDVVIVAPDPANPDAPLEVGDTFRVDATWSVPDTAQAGDTFTLEFPGPVTGYSSTFELKDPDGHVVGTCVVSSDKFVCTLSDYVNNHTDVEGSLFFYATASGETDDTVVFTTGDSTTIETPVPGGGVGVPGDQDPPTQPGKFGSMNPDGQSIHWTVLIPGEDLAPVNGDDLVLTDTYDSGLTLVTSSLKVGYVPTAEWTSNFDAFVPLPQGTGAETYTFVNDAANSQFDVTINAPVTDGSRIYVIAYDTTVPAGTPDGTTFDNQVTANGGKVASGTAVFVTAGGDGSGTTKPSGGTPTTTPSDTPTPTPSDTPTPTPSDTPSPTTTPPATPSASPSVTPTATPSPSDTPSPSFTPTPSVGGTVAHTPTPDTPDTPGGTDLPDTGSGALPALALAGAFLLLAGTGFIGLTRRRS